LEEDFVAKLTFWDIIDRTLIESKEPLSPKEIWDKAITLGITKEFNTTGKTPWATIGAYLYTEINNNLENSKYIQVSERPAQFYLRSAANEINFEKITEKKEIEKEKSDKISSKKFNERDLHPLLVTFCKTDTHFRANLKTIFHEQSIKAKKGLNEWLHPDLVGVYFPFKEYNPETIEIQKGLSVSSVKLFSFELKINLTFGSLRRDYFQAVSNSSWANEGYIVALNIDDDSTLMDEIRRLNNAFGIGVIKLNSINVYESEILFPAKEKAEIDWDTVNRLAKENIVFSDFLRNLSEDIKLGKIKSTYDEFLTPEKVEKYINDKKINVY